jgi:hypothetical protein
MFFKFLAFLESFKGGNVAMKLVKYLALLSTLALLFPLAAFARDKNQHSLNIPDAVKIGQTQLKPGDYKVDWQGAGPNVQVKFLQYGKTVATAPATLHVNDSKVIQNDIVTGKSTGNTAALREIDFAHQKEALVFAQGS